jgi:hypothetical protein
VAVVEVDFDVETLLSEMNQMNSTYPEQLQWSCDLKDPYEMCCLQTWHQSSIQMEGQRVNHDGMD